jgi:hypothetical protein
MAISKKNGIVKMGLPILHQLLKIEDMFDVIKDKRHMDRYTAGREGRDAFLAWVRQEGGDIHYFKKQNFTPKYANYGHCSSSRSKRTSVRCGSQAIR